MPQTQVKLLSSDSQVFDVDEEVAFMSETIKNTLEGEQAHCFSLCTCRHCIAAFPAWLLFPLPGWSCLGVAAGSGTGCWVRTLTFRGPDLACLAETGSEDTQVPPSKRVSKDPLEGH